jgi:hypothetical protein
LEESVATAGNDLKLLREILERILADDAEVKRLTTSALQK